MIIRSMSFSGSTYEAAQIAMEREMCRLHDLGAIVSWRSDPPFRGFDGRWHVDAEIHFHCGVAA